MTTTELAPPETKALHVRLTKGLVAVISPEDAAEICSHKWQAQVMKGRAYAYRNLFRNGKRIGKEYMHRAILKPPPGTEVDHIDWNGLNNQRANLRIATRSQNNANQRCCRKRRSQYKGVVLHESGRWRAQTRMTIDGVRKGIHIGYFSSERDAALAYDAFMRRRFGDYAHTNF